MSLGCEEEQQEEEEEEKKEVLFHVKMAASREPEDVIVSRGGSVLGKKTILKSDHFPGCQNKRLLPHVDGAPNYRQVGSLPVYGVAIPTADGIRKVLELVGANKFGGQRVLWHNLREEPVVYINGRPFVLREVERPFTNLEYTVKPNHFSSTNN